MPPMINDTTYNGDTEHIDNTSYETKGIDSKLGTSIHRVPLT